MSPRQFQLTRPRGTRHYVPTCSASHSSFNSRVREGRDRRHAAGSEALDVSTHASARDATRLWGLPVMRRDVSTHASARDATATQLQQLAELKFQLTRPRGTRPARISLKQLLYLFQLTRPRGTRQTISSTISVRLRFNSRVREGRDVALFLFVSSEKFQLTRPRGTRRGRAENVALCAEFQLTRPRGTRLSLLCHCSSTPRFQLTRPRGTRPRRRTTAPKPKRFNSRVREGRDLCLQASCP